MQRNQAIDISKGIAILLMIVGHSAVITQNWSNWIFKTIFSFHMPLFIIFSGYFFKEKSTKETFYRGIKQLVKPYLITGITSFFIILILNKEASFDYLKGILIGTLGNHNSFINYWPLQAGPIWFLLSLFWCKLFFNIIFKVSSRFYFEISLCLSILFLYIGKHYINLPLCIGSGFTFLIFYAIGKRINNVNLLSFIHRNIFVISSIWIGAIWSSRLNLAQYICDVFPLSIFGALCGSFFIFFISSKMKGWVSTLFVFIGKNTLPILCCHSVAFIIKNEIINSLGYNSENLIINDLSYLFLTIAFIFIYFVYKRLTNEKSTDLG